MAKILAFDVGGSKIAYAVFDERGNLLSDVHKMPTPRISADIAALVMKIRASCAVDGIGIATAGVVCRNKLAGKPINLPEGYENIDFETLTGLPCVMENDANSAVWAEYKSGSLQGCINAAMLTLGTGVGCGLVLNEQLYGGTSGASGEVRFPIAGTDLATLAYKYGCAESDCFKIKNLAQNGVAAAQKTLQIWHNELIKALVVLQEILDLDAVALSGSVAQIVDYPKVEAAVRQQIWQPNVRILPAATGNNAGLIGAALLWGKKHG